MSDPLRNAHLTDAIAMRAASADCSDGSLVDDIAALRDAGWLRACLPKAAGGLGWGCEPDATMAAFEALRMLGRANLSVARLFEGHMNAVKLVQLYAGPDLLLETWELVERGGLLGVWGADAVGNPLTAAVQNDPFTLSGAKRFASGLGLVQRAVVTVPADDGVQLLLVPVDEPDRSDRHGWSMSGMRATQSGTYDFTGIILAARNRLGRPGDYFIEPFFEGGIWRYCAAHLGGAEALYYELRAALVASNRAGDPHQESRLETAAIARETDRLWIMRSAAGVEAAGATPPAATLSLLAREVTETSCRTVLDQVERALGMAAFIEGSTVERMRRDLALFLCQAAPDAKRSRAAKALVAQAILPEFL